MALPQTMALDLSDPPGIRTWSPLEPGIRTMPKNTWSPLAWGHEPQCQREKLKFNLKDRGDLCVSVLCKRFEGDEGRHFFAPVLSAFASLNEVE